MIEAGAQAPDFTLPDQDQNDVTLADFAGSKLVIAFYPFDFSPVCTDQLSIYQEVLGEIESRGAKLVAISIDSPYAHKAFQEKLGLTIPLLSDSHPKGEVARAYGAEARLVESDYQKAFAYLGARHRKRALLVLFTDVLSRDQSRLMMDECIRSASRHLPLTVTVRDVGLDRLAAGVPTNAAAAYRQAAAEELLLERESESE